MRPYSVAPGGFLVIKRYGPGSFSERLHELRVGDGVQVRGFFDCVYSPTDAPAHLVLLGGGTGIIPLVALALDALRDGVPVTLVVTESARACSYLLN